MLVANPSELAAITKSQKKSDQRDARMLAKLARVDPELLRPLRHRSAQAQTDLALLKARHALGQGAFDADRALPRDRQERRGRACPSARPRASTSSRKAVPVALREALEPLLRQVGELSQKIWQLERKIEEVAQERYPESKRLAAPGSVGQLTALCFMLVVGDAERFAKKPRGGGPTWGWRPKRISRCQVDKQCRISKAGNPYLRVLLVQCAQHLLSRRGKDCELRRWGLKLCERGGKAAKKRAVIATARKLAVQLHALWAGPEAYDPFYAAKKQAQRGGGGGEAARAVA